MLPRRLKHLMRWSNLRSAFYKFTDSLQEAVGLTPSPTEIDPYEPLRGALVVTVESGQLFDSSRNVGLSYELYRPEFQAGPLPVIVYSPGLPIGSFVEPPESQYLARHLAAHAYVVVSLTHTDTDRQTFPDKPSRLEELRQATDAAINSWDNLRRRFLDISFAIDSIEGWVAGDGPRSGQIDKSRIGLCGYCWGGRAALPLLGERSCPMGHSYKDRRIKAAAVLSPSPAWQSDASAEIFADIDVPTLFMSGSRDYSLSQDLKPDDRVIPHHLVTAPEQRLLMLSGADHGVFSGHRNGKPIRARDPRHHQLIRSVSLAFWDAYLKEDAAARRWLNEDFAHLLGREGRWSLKC